MRKDSTLNDLYKQRKLVRRCVDYQSPVITFTDLRGDSQKHKKAATFFFSQDAKKQSDKTNFQAFAREEATWAQPESQPACTKAKRRRPVDSLQQRPERGQLE
jgi:hypothetical protein